MIDSNEGELKIGGVPARDLARCFGTPLYVYDADTVRERYRALADAIRHRPCRIHYAAVCNPNLALLRLLRREGAGLHANTPGDVYCGLAAGFSPEDIVFSGSNIGDDDVEFLVRSRVHVNVDSLEDLARVAKRAPGRALGLRVHIDDVLPESRIGLVEAELPEALRVAASFGCRVTALHVYCGTHGQKLALWKAAVARLGTLAAELPDIDCLNIGGGFGYDYRDPDAHAFPFADLAAMAESMLGALSSRRARPITLRLEPGRALVAGAGVLLTRVRSVKARRARRYVGVDTTVANFTSPVVHGPHRRVVAASSRTPSAIQANICGCTTYSRDFIARDVELPDVAVGDVLAVLDVGAYGYCMASHFLNRPKPAEVVVDDGVARLVTRRQSFADLVATQIPRDDDDEVAERRGAA